MRQVHFLVIYLNFFFQTPMLRYHVNRFETGVTSGSRGSETNDRKIKYLV